MILHVLTAVTRPENLPAIQASIDRAAERAPADLTIAWEWLEDPERQHVGGQHLKNRMLNGILPQDWVCILDDDTLMHERFLQKVYGVVARKPGLEAIVVSQQRVNGTILKARPENAVLGKIDAGQAVLRKGFIGKYRIPETYAGDGIWLETLLRGRTEVAYLSSVLSLHNAISGIDVGPPQEVEA